MSQRRVAGAEDTVRWHVFAEFIFQRRLHVNVGQHTKAFCFKGRGDNIYCVLEIHGNRLAKTVFLFHVHYLAIKVVPCKFLLIRS